MFGITSVYKEMDITKRKRIVEKITSTSNNNGYGTFKNKEIVKNKFPVSTNLPNNVFVGLHQTSGNIGYSYIAYKTMLRLLEAQEKSR